MTRGGAAFTASLATSAYLPTFVYEVGVGVLLPILALSPVRMGGSAALGGAAVAAYGIGSVLGDGWGGVFAARRPPVRVALLGVLVTTLAALACWGSTSVGPFLVGAVLLGVGHGITHVARQSVVVDLVAFAARARALTTLAGTWRVANFVGPLLGSIVIGAFGLRSAYLLGAAFIAAGALAIAISPAWKVDPTAHRATSGSLSAIARSERRIIATLGSAALLTGAVRAARLAAVPLWAEHIGVPDHTASAIYAASAAVDMLLFFPAGLVMDARGRRWTAVPSTLLLGAGLLAIPLTSEPWQLTVAAVALGLGNGWGSGLLMTLGHDVAPRDARPAFMGLWSLIIDLGGLAGPAVVAVIAVASLGAGISAIGAIGVLATGLLYRWTPPGPPQEPEGALPNDATR